MRTGARATGDRAQAAARVVVASTAGDVEGARARRLRGARAATGSRAWRGSTSDVAIVPFRGEYWMLAPERAHLVKNLIYPVPDPAFPFLGVHFTRRIGGGDRGGPERRARARARGLHAQRASTCATPGTWRAWPGFWRMARKHWRAGLGEQWRSLSRGAFARACAALVPDDAAERPAPGGAGVRAQAVGRDGALVDDFAIAEAERMVHVVNAPSPAATASLAIGEEIALRAARWL